MLIGNEVNNEMEEVPLTGFKTFQVYYLSCFIGSEVHLLWNIFSKEGTVSGNIVEKIIFLERNVIFE